MSASVSITRLDLDASGLRQAASRSHDANAARRMLALALILEGRTRTEAAMICGMERQTLRDWVHRYNAEGLAGLSDRPLPGAP
ncbi:helix-turn-helix domain-containing protein, partial [Asticcacaulis sp. AC402]|uniref:helix-turn-helix domain-containing protein n=1 Tax=Asticcacaulis sp. AC402 TaxID=1282361 RepID=UPI0012DCA163